MTTQPVHANRTRPASAWSVLPLLLLHLPAAATATEAEPGGDWPQWRGPGRDGVARAGFPLAEAWPKAGPPVLWDSEPVPGGDDGGHGSPVVSGGRVFLSVVWHRDVRTETRAVDDLVLRKLGYRRLDLPEALAARAEEARLNLPRGLRGRRLNDWAEKWVEEHLTPEQAERFGNYLAARFRQGRQALPLAVLDRLATVRKRRFPDEEAFQAWLAEQRFDDEVERRVKEAVPATRKAAEDVVLCLDAATGKTLWKSSATGEPTGRRSSSTPSVSGGRVYAVGSTHLYCVDASAGGQVWSSPLPVKGPASSPLVAGGRVFLFSGSLTAFDAADGALLWSQRDAPGENSSPVAWKDLVIAQSKKGVVAVDPASGKTAWSLPGGGDSTPLVHGDDLVVLSAKDKDPGLAAYRLGPGGATRRWHLPMKLPRAASTPVVSGGHVFLAAGGRQLCVGLGRGEEVWVNRDRGDIVSPLLAGDKLITLQSNGRDLVLLRASAGGHEELARAKVNALRCPSPALAGGRLVLRLEDRLRCYDLRADR